MKNGLLIGLAIVILGAGGLMAINSNKAAVEQNATESPIAHEKTAVFTIENMTCAMCPITVKKAIQGVDGAKSVAIDFEDKIATVVFDPSETTAANLADASTNAGYPASITGEKK